MVFLLCSDNSELSYVLQKNPATGFVTHTLGKGLLVGWYTPNNENRIWCVTFIDAPNKSSFGAQNSESGDYLDYERFASPSLVPATIRNLLDHLLVDKHSEKVAQYDVRTRQALTICPIHLPRYKVEMDQNTAKAMGLDLVAESLPVQDDPHAQGPLFRISITATQMSVTDFIRRCYLLSLIWDNSIAYDNVKVDHAYAEKIGKIIASVDLPYFARKQLLLRLIGTNTKAVSQYLKYFEKPGLSLVAGTNAQIRQRFVEKHLSQCPAFNILMDYGCGDRPCKKWRTYRADDEAGWLYIAVDKDEKVQEKMSKLESEMCKFCTGLDEARVVLEQSADQRLVIIATEVVEHLPPQEALPTLLALLCTNPRMLITTTPNRDFNVSYGFSPEQTRHIDHLKEYSEQEWSALVNGVLNECPDYQAMTIGIGDKVGQHHNILGTVFEKRYP